MSLTRDQWVEMWESTNELLKIANSMQNSPKRRSIYVEVRKIREQIQSVIGQME